MSKTRIIILLSIISAAIIATIIVLTWQTSDSTSQNVENNSSNIQNTIANKPIANVPKQNLDHDRKLQAEADSLLKLFNNMPQVPVYLKDEPIMKTGSETQRGLAYATCEPDRKPTIFISCR